jgi:hypothetical protein
MPYPRRSPSTKSPPTATFKGREKELDELTEAIRDGTVAILGRAGDGRDRQDGAGAEAGPFGSLPTIVSALISTGSGRHHIAHSTVSGQTSRSRRYDRIKSIPAIDWR